MLKKLLALFFIASLSLVSVYTQDIQSPKQTILTLLAQQAIALENSEKQINALNSEIANLTDISTNLTSIIADYELKMIDLALLSTEYKAIATEQATELKTLSESTKKSERLLKGYQIKNKALTISLIAIGSIALFQTFLLLN